MDKEMSIIDIGKDYPDSLNEFSEVCHKYAKKKGWWDGEERKFAEIMALLHSEISEALEEHRSGHSNIEVYFVEDKDGNDKPEGVPIELADVLIRIFDFCGKHGIDLDTAYQLKMDYNFTRPYRHGGKKI